MVEAQIRDFDSATCTTDYVRLQNVAGSDNRETLREYFDGENGNDDRTGEQYDLNMEDLRGECLQDYALDRGAPYRVFFNGQEETLITEQFLPNSFREGPPGS